MFLIFIFFGMALKLSYIKALVKEWFLGIYFRDFNLFYFKRKKSIASNIYENSTKYSTIIKTFREFQNILILFTLL